MSQIKEELNKLRIDIKTYEEKQCSEEENKKYRKLLKNNETDEILPENITYEFDMVHGYIFYDGIKTDLTPDEIKELLEYKKINILNTIKRCVLFFTIFLIIELICQFILVISV